MGKKTARGQGWPRILWMSNAPWAGTGYGNQTALITRRIVDDGGELSIFAFYGHQGGMTEWGGITVYPPAEGHHQFGADVVGQHAKDSQADVVITLVDAWILDPGMCPTARWCPLFPVDSEPVSHKIVERVRPSWQPLTFSRHATAEVEKAGLTPLYVPHGVDTRVYTPGKDPAKARAAARDRLSIPQDAYVVGMVAANRALPVDRKSIAQTITAFAELAKHDDKALLFCHSYDAGFMARPSSVDFTPLVARLGLIGKVFFSHPYRHLIANYGSEWMADAYRVMDVLASPSMGEGFGVPIIEAQACGTPVIVGGWTAMPELVRAGETLDREDDAEPSWWPEFDTYQYVAHVDAIAGAMIRCHDDDVVDRAWLGHTIAEEYDADVVHERYWRPALDAIAGRIAVEQGTNTPPPVELIVAPAEVPA